MRPIAPLAFALSALAVRAAAADQRVTIEWSAPAECPTASEVEERVAARIPSDLAARARGRVEKAGARYRAALSIGPRGERTLEADTCDALASSVAVVIAMSVIAAEEHAPATAPEAPEPARPAPPPPPEPPRFAVGAEAAAATGTLPEAAFGGGIAASFAPIHELRVEIVARVWLESEGRVDSARGASFRLLSGTARACWVLTRGTELGPCLGAEIALAAASGFGVVRTEDVRATTWGPEVLAALRVPIAGPLALRAGAGAVFPLTRPSFVITAAGTVHEPAAIALRGALGPEVLF